LAELEGRATDSIRTQNELLDANINAYQNQMRILRDLIDGTREEEAARRAALEVQLRQYAQEKQTARAQRERLQEMIRLQDEVNRTVIRIHDDITQYLNEHEYQETLRRITATREGIEGDSRQRRLSLEMAADTKYAEFRLGLLKETIAEEMRLLEQARDAAGENGNADRMRELDAQFTLMQESAHIRTVNRIKTLYAEMMEGIYGRGAEERIRSLYNMQIAELRKVMDERISQEERWRNFAIDFEDDPHRRANLERDKQEAIEEIRREFGDREVAARENVNRRIEELNRQMVDNMLSEFDRFLAATQAIANNINTIWTNNIDRQTQEKLRANDTMVQSDEERAAKEREILKRAALERYKAELFAWTANVTFATAQAGMATLTAFAEALKGTGPAGPAIAAINAALVAAVSATKVAAVISAKPNPPRFHTGTASVPGRTGQEVPAILMAGETVLPQGDFRNVMQAFANLANMAYRPAAPAYKVDIHNTASRDVKASASFDADGLKVVIKKLVGNEIANGGFDNDFNKRDMRNNGRGLGTF